MTELKPEEGFSWLKWVKGIFDFKNTAKLTAFACHIGLWIGIVMLILFVFGKVKNYFSPSKALASPVAVTDNSGSIETGADKRSKIGLINF